MFEPICQNLILLAYSPHNPSRDILVAVIAIGLGLNICYAALTENTRCFDLSSVRAIERNFGRGRAQFFLIGVGTFCIFLGALLFAQLNDRKSEVGRSGTAELKGAIEK